MQCDYSDAPRQDRRRSRAHRPHYCRGMPIRRPTRARAPRCNTTIVDTHQHRRTPRLVSVNGPIVRAGSGQHDTRTIPGRRARRAAAAARIGRTGRGARRTSARGTRSRRPRRPSHRTSTSRLPGYREAALDAAGAHRAAAETIKRAFRRQGARQNRGSTAVSTTIPANSGDTARAPAAAPQIERH
jgi:hypothetical protein